MLTDLRKTESSPAADRTEDQLAEAVRLFYVGITRAKTQIHLTYQLFAGVLNFLCTNGLVVGDCVDEVRIPHKGDVMGRVIEGVYTVLDTFDRVDEFKDGMKAITLSPDEQTLFARSALQLRYDPADGPVPITETQVLEARR